MGRNAYCMRFRPVPSEGESFMASKQKILIVDDDNNIAELISLYLTKECYDTKIVNDGEEAVREFHSFQPNLILLDLMLPGMDGYQVCREIRHDSDVPIIMLSAKGEVFDKVLGLELGADDYIIKPFDSKELVARVKAVLRSFGIPNTLHISSKVMSGYSYLIHIAFAASIGDPPPIATIQSGWNSSIAFAPRITVSTDGSDSIPSKSCTSMPASFR